MSDKSQSPSVPPDPAHSDQQPTRESFDALSAIKTDPQLRQAFENFSRDSMRLRSDYNTLEAQFRQISAQLHEVYCQLEVKIKEIDASHRYLESLLGQMSQGVLFVTRDGVILTCNRAMLEWFALNATLKGKPFSECFADQQFGFSMQEALTASSAPPLSYCQVDENPTCPILEITANFVTHPSDPTAEESQPSLQEGLLITAREVGELRRLQVRAASNDRLRDLGRVASDLTQELRTSLNAIERAAAAIESPAGVEIQGNCGAISQMLDRVVAYAQTQEAQLTLVDLKEIIERAAELARAQNLFSGAKTLNLRAPQSISGLADSELLETSLLNILDNAANAIAETGTVNIELSQTPEAAVIEIRDDGVGIPQEHLSKIFSPFFTTKMSSAGLGLSEVHKRLIAMNAQIDVLSTPSVGSTFIIKVPLKA